jgi:hypothetical protein
MTAQIYSDNEIARLIEKLNASYPVPVQWTCTRAIKDHIDLFDKKIVEGEHYYRLSMDDSRSNDIKLSHCSMERFLFILFVPRPYWEKDVDKAIDSRFEAVRQIIDKLRPV